MPAARKPQCKHCGATNDLLPKKDGTPSSVCRHCRSGRVGASRGRANARHDGIVTREHVAPDGSTYVNTQVPTVPKTAGEREKAIQEALRESADGSSLVDALRRRGVV